MNREIDNKELISAVKDSWIKVTNELSYCGKRKAAIYAGFDSRFGKDGWIPAHILDGEVISRLEAYLVYEEGYYQLIKNRPDIRRKLQSTASEVYDIQPSNLNSGFDYLAQECAATHLQDISLRRALTRLALEEKGIRPDTKNLPKIPIFFGDHPVQIRDHTSEGYYLNPGKVPFHKPELILDTEQSGWWDPKSTEDWYQKNKVLLVDPSRLVVSLAMVSPSQWIFSYDDNIYYSAERRDSKPNLLLRRIAGKKARGLYSENMDLALLEEAPYMPYGRWLQEMQKLDLGKLNGKRSMGYKDLAGK